MATTKYYQNHTKSSVEEVSALSAALELGNITDLRRCSDGSAIIEITYDEDYVVTLTDLLKVADHYGVSTDDVCVDGGHAPGLMLIEVLAPLEDDEDEDSKCHDEDCGCEPDICSDERCVECGDLLSDDDSEPTDEELEEIEADEKACRVGDNDDTVDALKYAIDAAFPLSGYPGINDSADFVPSPHTEVRTLDDILYRRETDPCCSDIGSAYENCFCRSGVPCCAHTQTPYRS